jgi:hypothetical protein
MDIINFIRLHKNLPVEQLPATIREFDPSIGTTSPYTVYYELFRKHYSGLNDKRLVELMNWINKKLNKMQPTASVEGTMSKIRGEIKKTFGYDSPQYRSSLSSIVFDKTQKATNIAAYQEKVFTRNENSQPIKISLINRLLTFRDSTNWKEKIIYLLINSGSRYEELFSGKFRLDTQKPHNIKLKNIAKTRDKSRTITKPLLDKDPENFLRVLNEIRALELNQVSSLTLINTLLNNTIGHSSYFLRKTYGNMAFHQLDGKKINKTTYLARILAHNPNNESTALSYQGYYIEEDAALQRS